MSDGYSPRIGTDAGHVDDVVCGGSDKTPGKAIRSRSLVVLPDNFEPKTGTPRTRSDCPTERPCPYVRCKWNLWMQDGRDTPGRRWGGERPSRVIAHVMQNCGADVADAVRRGRMTNAELAEAIGYSERQIRRIVRTAKRKLAAHGERAHELFKLLTEDE